MATSLFLLAALVVVGTVIGLLHRHRSGKVRQFAPRTITAPTTAPTAATATAAATDGRSGSGSVTTTATATEAAPAGEAADLAADGARLTVVQFSTPMCSRCPGTARLANSLADDRPGVRHVEIDLVNNPEMATRFRVSTTPTLLLVDETGDIRARTNGAPTRADLAQSLDTILEETA